MKKLQMLLLGGHFFCNGLMTPILSLLLLARGCSLTTLPIVMGVYTLVVVALEFPSGIFADKFGRKRTYLLSVGFELLCVLLLLAANSIWWLLSSMVLHGLGRAFSSGSLDALIIDDFVARHGEEKLSVITSQLEVVINVSIAAGSLCGGLLPFTAGYSVQLWVRLGLTAAIGLGCLLFITEIPDAAPHEQRGRVQVRGNRPLLRLLCCLAALGGTMSMLSIYWTPQLQTLLRDSSGTLLFGLLSGGSFVLMTLGALWSGRLKIKGPRRWSLYFALQLGLGLTVLLLAVQQGAVGFSLFYSMFYLVLGVSNIHEQTLLNGLANGCNRAATLSLGSFCMQLASLGGTGLAALLAGAIGISGLWLAASAAAILVVASMCVWHSLPTRVHTG